MDNFPSFDDNKKSSKPDTLKRLKNGALAAIFLVIALILLIAFLGKVLSWAFTLILWLLTGIFGLVFIILFCIFLYRYRHPDDF
ncbi:MAG: hypothetical protein K2J23_08550 [Muribaculaceae bacterium]|nr:hypothetical protein [Muribaculaceae bacterium]